MRDVVVRGGGREVDERCSGEGGGGRWMRDVVVRDGEGVG